MVANLKIQWKSFFNVCFTVKGKILHSSQPAKCKHNCTNHHHPSPKTPCREEKPATKTPPTIQNIATNHSKNNQQSRSKSQKDLHEPRSKTKTKNKKNNKEANLKIQQTKGGKVEVSTKTQDHHSSIKPNAQCERTSLFTCTKACAPRSMMKFMHLWVYHLLVEIEKL